MRPGRRRPSGARRGRARGDAPPSLCVIQPDREPSRGPRAGHAPACRWAGAWRKLEGVADDPEGPPPADPDPEGGAEEEDDRRSIPRLPLRSRARRSHGAGPMSGYGALSKGLKIWPCGGVPPRAGRPWHLRPAAARPASPPRPGPPRSWRRPSPVDRGSGGGGVGRARDDHHDAFPRPPIVHTTGVPALILRPPNRGGARSGSDRSLSFTPQGRASRPSPRGRKIISLRLHAFFGC
jgi:hypothetical protein